MDYAEAFWMIWLSEQKKIVIDPSSCLKRIENWQFIKK